MKWKLLLCGAALAAVGCAHTQSDYDSYKEFGYTFDLVPQPVPGLTPDEANRIFQAPAVTPAQFPNPTLPNGTVIQPVPTPAPSGS